MAQRQHGAETARPDVEANEEDVNQEVRERSDRDEQNVARSETGWGGAVGDTTRAVRQAAQRENILPDLGTAAVVGGAVALIESELLPGVLIGAGALLARRVLPVAGLVLKPVVKTAFKAGYGVYASARSMLAEASEEVDDIVAEARAEREKRAPRGAAPASP